MTIDYIEKNDDKTITLNDLYDVMKIKSGFTYDDIYSKSYMKQKLIDNYGQNVSITTIRQKQKQTSNLIHRIQEADEEGKTVETGYLIGRIGKYIRTDIRCMETHKD